MTTQLLAAELTNLIQESKRKHNDLKVVCRPIPCVLCPLSDPLTGSRKVT